MTQITFQDGKIVMRDGQVGTGEGCCCQDGDDYCCICGGYVIFHSLANVDIGGEIGLWDTEAEALDALESLKNGPFGGTVTFDEAVSALSEVGCGDNSVYYGEVGLSSVYEGQWTIYTPSIHLRCCGPIEPEGGCYDGFDLKPGYIDTGGWLNDGFCPVYPCVDDGSYVQCYERGPNASQNPCSPDDPCYRGPCPSTPLFSGDTAPCSVNPLP